MIRLLSGIINDDVTSGLGTQVNSNGLVISLTCAAGPCAMNIRLAALGTKLHRPQPIKFDLTYCSPVSIPKYGFVSGDIISKWSEWLLPLMENLLIPIWLQHRDNRHVHMLLTFANICAMYTCAVKCCVGIYYDLSFVNIKICLWSVECALEDQQRCPFIF